MPLLYLKSSLVPPPAKKNNIQDTTIDPVYPPAPNDLYLYNRATYNVRQTAGQYKYLRLKNFNAGYNIPTLADTFNNNIIVKDITNGTSIKYTFGIRRFQVIGDLITYLNTVCAASLVFEYVDPATNDSYAAGSIRISHVDTTIYWQLEFNAQSIFRPLGFQPGLTDIVPPPSNPANPLYLIGNYIGGLTTIATILISINLSQNNFSNTTANYSFIVNAELGPTNGIIFSFNENTYYRQQLELKSTQFNQIQISIHDEFNNVINLGSFYELILELTNL